MAAGFRKTATNYQKWPSLLTQLNMVYGIGRV